MKGTTLNWTVVLTTIFIVLGGITVVLEPESFQVMLQDGSLKAKYSEGEFTLYEGRSITFRDTIQPYYYNGNGYTKMYKARGDKYSNLEYAQNGDTLYVKQDITYSKGVLTRYFEVSEYEIKESFEWVPESEDLRVYFSWDYSHLDEIDEKIVYLDKNVKGTSAVLEDEIVNVWTEELDNTVRVERFQNGILRIRTKVFEGSASYDPEIRLVARPIITTNCKMRTVVDTLQELDYVTSVYNKSSGKNEDVLVYKDVISKRLEVYDCKENLKLLSKTVVPKDQDYKCSTTKGLVVCDSLIDGNGDGVCNSGEHCCKFKTDGEYTCKNGDFPAKNLVMRI